MTYKKAELKLDYILKRYYKFAKLWSLDSKKLVEYVLWDYKINLKLGTVLKFFPIYKKNGKLRIYIDYKQLNSIIKKD